MNKKLKKLVSGTSVTLCALIAFSLPTQVLYYLIPNIINHFIDIQQHLEMLF